MLRRLGIWKVGRRSKSARDFIAVEEPLSIKINDEPFAVIMRTPGSDVALTAGFLLTEGIIETPQELGILDFCAQSKNTVNVRLPKFNRKKFARRNILVSSACGYCGRVLADEMYDLYGPIKSKMKTEIGTVLSLPEKMKPYQDLFRKTGGVHCAALFSDCGGFIELAEDVGRHNAVDKLLGHFLLEDFKDFGRSILAVSGRAGYEIVFKAYRAGIPVLCAVGAPSSLSVELARKARMGLVAFIRGTNANVYSNHHLRHS